MTKTEQKLKTLKRRATTAYEKWQLAVKLDRGVKAARNRWMQAEYEYSSYGMEG